MRTIVNRTSRPLRITLPGGGILHLAPAHTGQISDEALETVTIAEMLDAGDIEIVEEAHPNRGGPQKAPHAGGRAHHPKTVVRPKGDR